MLDNFMLDITVPIVDCNSVTSLRNGRFQVSTSPVRVPEAVHREVLTASRLFGCNASELLERAWQAYRQSPEFVDDFALAQKAFSVGDVDAVASLLHDRSTERARRRAASVQALRREVPEPSRR